MGRNENENLDGLNLPPVSTAVVTDHTHDNITCSRVILDSNTNITTYYVLCAGGMLFDPYNTDVRYRSRNRWKLRRVNRTMYELYMKFIDTRHRTFLHQAEREI